MKAQTDAPRRLLKSVLAARGMTYGDLARLTGLKVSTVKQVAGGFNKSAPARAKISGALGICVWPDESSLSSLSSSVETRKQASAALSPAAAALAPPQPERVSRPTGNSTRNQRTRSASPASEAVEIGPRLESTLAGRTQPHEREHQSRHHGPL
jgi:hypothetical protein